MTRTMRESVNQQYSDETVNIALDTIARGKQALIFCNTKRGAASQAEKIATKIKRENKNEQQRLKDLSKQILSAVNSPTKQCKRLAACIRKGTAFHHAGLNSRQRDIVESSFRAGDIFIICATPTLAMGMDLPAYRSIIRDLKRFSSGTSWGMADIPVLEYEQMAGRAGRPGKEDLGQAICMAGSESEREHIIEKYLRGEPEQIFSKLAVEPVLRTYVLSLIAAGYVHDKQSLYTFFDGTFYAWQYQDRERLHGTLDRMIVLLQGWGFIDSAADADGFAVASEALDESLKATRLGERVAQLYLDPYTAHHILSSTEKARAKGLRPTPMALLHMIATTLEIRPLFSVRKNELDDMDSLLIQFEQDLFVQAPGAYSYEYEEYLQALKTAQVLHEWISEVGEDQLLERYRVTPGELQAKRSIADWILYSTIELAKLKGWQDMIAEVEKLRVRLEHGAKEELLGLLRLKGIGRVRARKLHGNGIRSIGDAKQAEYSALRSLLGEKTAASVKGQLGQKVDPAELRVKENKRKGQINLMDYDSS